MARGNATACGLPLLAILSITTPPGYPRLSSFAALSNASPAASSRVWPNQYINGAPGSSVYWPPKQLKQEEW